MLKAVRGVVRVSRHVYEAVAADLDAMGKARYFLGGVGAASRMKIVVNGVMGGMLACFVSPHHPDTEREGPVAS